MSSIDILTSKITRSHKRKLHAIGFESASLLGYGSGGSVFKCVKQHRTVALKIHHEVGIENPIDEHDDISHEFSILNKLGKHPCIISIWTVNMPDKFTYPLFVMRSYTMDLYTYLIQSQRRKLHITLSVRLYIMSAILHGLSFIHGHGVVHRDIKLGNILCDVDVNFNITTVVITDFGAAVMEDWNNTTKTIECGSRTTLAYMPPEFIKQTYTNYIQGSTDVWGAAIIWLCLHSRKVEKKLHSCPNFITLLARNGIEFFPYVSSSIICVEERKIISGMLQKHARDRPDSKTVYNTISSLRNKIDLLPCFSNRPKNFSQVRR
jgi:serine/threonine protein kinase